MLPRKKLDISFSDLLFAAVCCLWPGRRETARKRLESLWAPDAVACLSVRSGFDLLLRAVEFPEGSEVLVSAITIRDMPRIVEEHGLVPVPVDLHMPSLSVPVEHLKRSVTSRTRAILVAHLFGSRMPLDDIAAFAREHGLMLIEDCAQAYPGSTYRGHEESDVCMFSFGPIKTNTALGGGILCIRDRWLRARVTGLQSQYRVQSRWKYYERLWKYAGIKLLLHRAPFTAFVTLARMMGRSHDDVMSSNLRGFPGPDFFTKIRRRPGYPLLALMRRRVARFNDACVDERIAAARAAISLMPFSRRPGSEAVHHTHWVFPILSASPDASMRHLWTLGFDATRGASSLFVLEPPPSRPEAVEARAAMAQVLYLPVYPGLRDREMRRLADAIATSPRFEGASFQSTELAYADA